MKKLELVEIWQRQGDLNINPVKELPEKLTFAVSKDPFVVAGSHDGAHSLPQGTEFVRDGLDLYVRTKVTAPMTHASRHKDSLPFEAGQIYRIWPEMERHSKEDQAVED